MWPQLMPLGSHCRVSTHLGNKTRVREPGREQESLPHWVTFGDKFLNIQEIIPLFVARKENSMPAGWLTIQDVAMKH